MDVINKLKHADKLIKNTSWMMVSELVAKISRIATIVIMAMMLSPAQYGIATLAVVCHELMRVFSRAGAGVKVIQCEDSELHELAANTSSLQWLLCISITTLQILIASSLSDFYHQPELQLLLLIMAPSYLLYPIVAIKVLVLLRENKMKYFGLASAACISIDNLSIIALLLLDFGVLSVAIAKLIAAFAWVVLFGIARVESIRPGFHRKTFGMLCVFSVKIFSTEGLKIVRSQLDVFVAGRLLSPEYFGIYSFAKNAGVGLGQSLSNAYINGLLPYVSEQLRLGQERESIQKAIKYAGFISIIFIAQACAAPIYVDLLFSDNWTGAALIVSLLCLTAIPAIFVDTVGVIYRVKNQAWNETLLILVCVVTTACCLLFLSPTTAISLAFTVCLGSIVGLLLCFYKVFYFDKKIQLSYSKVVT